MPFRKLNSDISPKKVDITISDNRHDNNHHQGADGCVQENEKSRPTCSSSADPPLASLTSIQSYCRTQRVEGWVQRTGRLRTELLRNNMLGSNQKSYSQASDFVTAICGLDVLNIVESGIALKITFFFWDFLIISGLSMVQGRPPFGRI